jgi:hypothetical protein
MIGRIQAIEGKTITVQAGTPESGCFGCLNQQCETKTRTWCFSAENTLDLSLSVGRCIETAVPARSVIKQAFLALVPLFAAFIAGYKLFGLGFPGIGGGAQTAAGAACLLIAAGATCLLRTRRPPKDKPVIVRVL